MMSRRSTVMLAVVMIGRIGGLALLLANPFYSSDHLTETTQLLSEQAAQCRYALGLWSLCR
ncbi:hypothetical protein [uncultured Chloroflexus sp.]|uniref:hypothetical protein n=1 Tax=uncultured Chloroflexus sp. TaxID=214040 RepID=UPI00260597B9|nr:hypothetical protein [uncultured Chloroflexus sp.]